MKPTLRVAVAQIAPVFLDRERSLAKVCKSLADASQGGAQLVVFGEAALPGYPVWLDRLEGARFESELQKTLHARYLEEAVQIEAGHLEGLCQAARDGQIAVAIGIIERPLDRVGKSLYCSGVYISAQGELQNVHRKLVPTYEERLSWSPGDGAGLVTFALGTFRVGRLMCWENWMPLARAALHAQGEDLHIAHWPGGLHNTEQLTPVLAREGRSFMISASCLLRAEDIPSGTPFREELLNSEDEILCNGGSCIADPSGAWLRAPVVDQEALIFADLEHAQVLRERQNFDPSGHYSRPDVLRLSVDRRRQSNVEFNDD